MSRGGWATRADAVLAPVFAALPRTATDAEIRRAVREAYPFGERAYWPYKVWTARVQAWRAAHRAGMARPMNDAQPARRTRTSRDDGATLELAL